MKFTSLLFICFLFFASFFNAQDSKELDSLKIVLKKLKQDTIRVNCLNEIAFKLKYMDAEATEKYCNEAIVLGQKLKHDRGLGVSYKIKGILSDEKGRYADAVDFYMKSLGCFQKTNDKMGVARTEANIGIVLRKLRKNNEALTYFRNSYSYFKDRHPVFEMTILMNIGIAYINLNKADSALFYTNSAYVVMQKNNIDDPNVYGNLGLAYSLKNDYKKAEVLLSKCLDAKKMEGNDPSTIAVWTENLANVYVNLNKNNEAIELLKESISLFGENKYINEATYAYTLIVRAYENINDTKNALKYYKVLAEIKDSVFDNSSAKQVFELKEKYETDKKNSEIELLTADKKIQQEALKKNRVIIYSVSGVLFLILLFTVFIIRSNKQKQIINNELLIKNNLIETQKREVEFQKEIVEEKQKEIIDSISYAKRLQEAILPPESFLNTHIPDNFVLYLPKDIVAGDFYWAEYIDNKLFLAAADSTGHGVPGALVSVVCSNALNRSVKEFNLIDTAAILDKTRELVLETFSKSSSDVKDGMDISLLCIDKSNDVILWSGANNPLWYIEDGEIKEIKANKQPIGKVDNPISFITHKINMRKGIIFYLFTDGYADQFGGPNGKKFKYKQFSDLLLKNSLLPLTEQKNILENDFNTWKNDLEQVDDVCVVGIKI